MTIYILSVSQFYFSIIFQQNLKNHILAELNDILKEIESNY